MSQTYHANAKTNGHIRQELIGSLNLTRELATRYSISQTTVRKWRNRSSITDVSSKPNVIHYALNDLEKEVIRVVRTLTWCSIDELTETVSTVLLMIPELNPLINYHKSLLNKVLFLFLELKLWHTLFLAKQIA